MSAGDPGRFRRRVAGEREERSDIEEALKLF